MTAPAAPMLRADAERNRRQILTSAARVFAEQGAEVPMEDIARAAGVGVGTLYRRFPDRDALIVAVALDSLAALLARMREAAVQEPRAWDALVVSMSYSKELKLSMSPTRSSPTAAAALKQDPAWAELRREVEQVLTELVEAAQREGTLRTDVGAGDVAQLFSLVYRAADVRPEGTVDLAARRALGVILDGLRTGEHRPLPGRPLEPHDLTRPG